MLVLEALPVLETCPSVGALQFPGLERQARTVGTLAIGVWSVRRVVPVIVVPTAAPPLVAFFGRHRRIGLSFGALDVVVFPVSTVAVVAHPARMGRAGRQAQDAPDRKADGNEDSVHDSPP